MVVSLVVISFSYELNEPKFMHNKFCHTRLKRKYIKKGGNQGDLAKIGKFVGIFTLQEEKEKPNTYIYISCQLSSSEFTPDLRELQFLWVVFHRMMTSYHQIY